PAALGAPSEAERPSGPGVPVHHPEYTEPHAPTLPGAESAAAEAEAAAEAGYAADVQAERPAGASAAASAAAGAAAPTSGAPAPAVPETPAVPVAEAETLQTAASSAASEASASHTAEPAGHLALDHPYGEGSAAPAADGSGPEGFTVKGIASTMVYYEDTSQAFEETLAEVWFLSPAHAEAAGFRPPRRTRK
ncbi:MAG: hypothetical protein JWN05_753, partial [Arthrobacter sp.]|nr:hypothetical protein [Arthrobacter sp.]